VKIVRSVAVVSAAAAMALVPVAAQANTYRHGDAAGDVVSGTSATSPAPQPDRANGDIVSSTIKHQRSKVIMRMTFRDLANTEAFNSYVFSIRSNRLDRDVVVVSASGIPAQVVVTKPGSKKSLKCKVKRRVDSALHTVTVKVPRSCLGNPSWVKVAMVSDFLTGFANSDTQFVDDALVSGGIHSSGPEYSPKIHR
jgi:hypothetical protein